MSFTLFVVTHVSIRTSDTSRAPHSCPFTGLRNAPLPLTLPSEPKASARGLSPGTSSAQEPLSRPVSCYAFFKGWLLLSQPPGCFGIPTSFPTEPRIGGLSCWSGLFPSSRWTLAPTVCLPHKFTGIRSLVRFGKAVSPPSPSSALPPVTYMRGST